MEKSGSLKAIQVFAKIAKVLSMIVFVLCIIGAVCSVIACAALLGVKGVQIRGHALAELLETKAGVKYWVGIAGCGFLTACCVAEAVIAKLSHKYFCREIEDGTPFTFGGAKQLMRLGITIAVIELVITIAGAVLTAVITKTGAVNFEMLQSALVKYAAENTKPADIRQDFNFSFGGSFGFAIAFIILSVIFRYGAEVRQVAYPDADQPSLPEQEAE